jgi:hypothetical protein
LRTYDDGYVPARTPGPLGVNDHADPNVAAYLGDTPGPMGIGDFADPDPILNASKERQTFSALLLDHARVANFLSSVAYMQATAEMVSLEKNNIGLWFSSTQVNTGNEATKDRLAEDKKLRLMSQFADACSRGSVAGVEFLVAQEQSRAAARTKIQEAFTAANQSNQATTKSLDHWVAGLKTTEYGAGMVLSVAGLFVSASAALVAGIIGFSYDTATTVIDDLNGARTVDADVLALVSRDTAKESGKSAGKEFSKTALAGKELEDIEKLQERVAHLHEKIALKQAMIRKTSSQHNAARLTRSIRKNEANLSGDLKQIRRFHGVTLLFLAWDLFEKAEKIHEAWKSE